MRERYGMDRRPIGRWITVAVIVVAFAGALFFVGTNVTQNPVEFRLVSWEVKGPDHVDVRISVDRPAEGTVTCVIRAQDSRRIDLGYAVVDIPAGEGGVLVDYPLATLTDAYTVELLGCAVDAEPGVSPPQFPPGVVPPEQPWVAG